MSTITEMAEVHAARIAERDATIASQAAEIEAYKHEAEVYREIKIEYEILLARSQREAAQIERLREALKPFADCVVHLHPAHDPEAETLDGIKVREWRAAYAALQPKEGE
jgi:hypothetical protein